MRLDKVARVATAKIGMKEVLAVLNDLGGQATVRQVWEKMNNDNPSRYINAQNGRQRVTTSFKRLETNSKVYRVGKNPATYVRSLDSVDYALAYEGLPLTDEELLKVDEGTKKLVSHILGERNAKIIQQYKKRFTKTSALKCEICDFDFCVQYGEIGRDFIEVHHKTPIADGQRSTGVDDLIGVCSNCHRMLHRNGLLTPDDLKKSIDDAARQSE